MSIYLSPMNVLKFGGTSIGTPERMRHVATLLPEGRQVMVVLSATSGTTNKLSKIVELISTGKRNQAFLIIDTIYSDALIFSHQLLRLPYSRDKVNDYLSLIHIELITLAKSTYVPKVKELILSKGELISTLLFSLYLEEQGKEVQLISAFDFMILDRKKEPDTCAIKEKITPIINSGNSETIFVTQGYICTTHDGRIGNLERGGSDYSSTLIGAAINAEEIQIWTDIDGMHNNDPRVISNTQPVPFLSYQEAAELAYFGAKILHPKTVHPAMKAEIPIRLKNTMNPVAAGTFISNTCNGNGVKAIAAKDDITMIRIYSTRMLMAYGFLKTVFEIFETFKTPIDMITTSEVAVSVTIDNETNLPSILKELQVFSTVKVSKEQVIICIAGSFPEDSKGYVGPILETLKNIPLKMVSIGGSEHNISLLVDRCNKKEVLSILHEEIFQTV